MPTIVIPVELRVEGEGDRVEVSLLRKDRSNPHKLCFQFSLSKADVESGTMCFVVYSALRQEMLSVLGQNGRKRTVGRTVPRKKSRTVSK